MPPHHRMCFAILMICRGILTDVSPRKNEGILEVVTLLETKDYRIVSIDTWLPTVPGPTPLINDWDNTQVVSPLDFIKTFDLAQEYGRRLGLQVYFNIDAERM